MPDVSLLWQVYDERSENLCSDLMLMRNTSEGLCSASQFMNARRWLWLMQLLRMCLLASGTGNYTATLLFNCLFEMLWQKIYSN